jgi:hypothetical protein
MIPELSYLLFNKLIRWKMLITNKVKELSRYLDNSLGLDNSTEKAARGKGLS